MHIEIDDRLCCSSGNCVLKAPVVFDQQETDGVVRVRHPMPPASEYQRVRSAVASCPTSAIRLLE
jgi:ferredoxin